MILLQGALLISSLLLLWLPTGRNAEVAAVKASTQSRWNSAKSPDHPSKNGLVPSQSVFKNPIDLAVKLAARTSDCCPLSRFGRSRQVKWL
jgi:hypothetical protein